MCLLGPSPCPTPSAANMCWTTRWSISTTRGAYTARMKTGPTVHTSRLTEANGRIVIAPVEGGNRGLLSLRPPSVLYVLPSLDTTKLQVREVLTTFSCYHSSTFPIELLVLGGRTGIVRGDWSVWRVHSHVLVAILSM